MEKVALVPRQDEADEKHPPQETGPVITEFAYKRTLWTTFAL